MSATITIYGSFPGDLASGKVDWLGDDIKVALLTATYSPNQDGDEEFGDVSSFEVSGTNYTAGGVTLTSKTMGYNPGTKVRKFDADDAEWNNSTITARYGVIYDDTHTDKPLIAYVDFGANRSSSEGLFRVGWHVDGIFEAVL